MADKIRLYRLDFAPDASKAERMKMCACLETTGAQVTRVFSKPRSGPFDLESTQELEYAQVTATGDWEASSIQEVMGNNPVFAKGTLRQAK